MPRSYRGLSKSGVDDGTRTHDDRDHNPGLYQLSYAHHGIQIVCGLTRFCTTSRGNGAPGRIRTCDRRLRRPMLYPAELRAHSSSLTGILAGRGRRIRTADPLLPKQLRYQTAPCPVSQASARRAGPDGAAIIRGRRLAIKGLARVYCRSSTCPERLARHE